MFSDSKLTYSLCYKVIPFIGRNLYFRYKQQTGVKFKYKKELTG